jgi:hypothetical protein
VRASPERRRLRFSFQFNNVKDLTGLSGPAVYARRRRRAAYLVAALFGVNRPFPAFYFRPELPWSEDKKITLGPGGVSLVSPK